MAVASGIGPCAVRVAGRLPILRKRIRNDEA
jgi:hypothetical protein